MAITAWPFETDDTTEVQYTQLLDALQESGVVDGLEVTPGAGLSVNVAPGNFLLKGLLVNNDGVANRAVDAAHATNTRLDYLILKRNFTTNSATIEVKGGTATSGGGTLPALQQDNAIWEHPLAVITVPGAATSLNPGDISERRSGLARGWVLYRNNTERPTPTRVTFGLNTTSKRVELFDGATWAALQIEWSSVANKPATFPPTIGSGAAEAVAGNDPRLTNARTPTVHSLDSHSGTLSIGKGGTGAADAAGARTNLQVPKATVQTAATADPTVGNAVGDLLIEY